MCPKKTSGKKTSATSGSTSPKEYQLILSSKTPSQKRWKRLGVLTIIRVWEYNEGSLTGGIRKFLRVNSKRLRRGLRNASPGGVPAKGNGYRLVRRGEGWSTTYSVTWLGKYSVNPQSAERVESSAAAKTKKLDSGT